MSGRRGVGLAFFDRQAQSSAQFSEVGSSMIRSNIEQLTAQLSTFQATLTVFAREHAAEIRGNSEFRGAFAKMCSVIGVDPLASGKGSGSAWSEALGVGDFYFELAIKVVELCRRSKDENGGLMSLHDATKAINDRNVRTGGAEVSEQDLVTAIKALEPLQSGFGIITIGSRRMIRSLPKEFSSDQTTVLEAAQILGYVSVGMLRDNLGWDSARAKTVLDDLLYDSLVWVDEQGAEREYWLASSIGFVH